MRYIVFVKARHCPRCSYIYEKNIKPVQDKYPNDVHVVTGEDVPEWIRKHGIKGAPTVLYFDADAEIGRTVQKHWTAEKNIEWLKNDRCKYR